MRRGLPRAQVYVLRMLMSWVVRLATSLGLALIICPAQGSLAVESFKNTSFPASSGRTDSNCAMLRVFRPEPSPIASGPSTEIDVAFEPLGVKTLLPSPRGYHAVLIIIDLNSGTQMAFEGNYSGTMGNFGYLRAGTRNLQLKPLVSGSVRELVTELFVPTANYINWLQQMVNEINSSNVTYSPTPELQWNAANSNTFVFSALTHMGLIPPPPPNPVTGVTPGYYNALEWDSN